MSTQISEWLEVIAKVLLLCWLFGFLLLLFWFGVYAVAGDQVLKIHGTWFDLTKHDFDLMNYYGMAFVKVCVFLFFLVPYIAIRLVLRKRNT